MLTIEDGGELEREDLPSVQGNWAEVMSEPVGHLVLGIGAQAILAGLRECRLDVFVDEGGIPANYHRQFSLRSLVSTDYDEVFGLNTFVAGENLLDDPSLITPRAAEALEALRAKQDAIGPINSPVITQLLEKTG